MSSPPRRFTSKLFGLQMYLKSGDQRIIPLMSAAKRLSPTLALSEAGPICRASRKSENSLFTRSGASSGLGWTCTPSWKYMSPSVGGL